jgi:hypothetical protein
MVKATATTAATFDPGKLQNAASAVGELANRTDEDSNKKAFVPENLQGAGLGLWVYRDDISEADAAQSGFFDPARQRFGLRTGDIVFVHTGQKVHTIGV